MLYELTARYDHVYVCVCVFACGCGINNQKQQKSRSNTYFPMHSCRRMHIAAMHDDAARPRFRLISVRKSFVTVLSTPPAWKTTISQATHHRVDIEPPFRLHKNVSKWWKYVPSQPTPMGDDDDEWSILGVKI